MGEKDIVEKTLEDHNDVFADIVNVLLFHGRRIVKEGDLGDTKTRSAFKADEKLRDQDRDVAKLWKNGQLRIAFLGMENQTDTDADMPLRVISYDRAAYKEQLAKSSKSKRKKEDIEDKEEEEEKEEESTRYPVVTLVLYFGYKKRWGKSKRLLECLKIPEELKPYVSDYRINLFEIAYLTEDEVELFQSDFRIVADYFVQMRKNRDYVASKQQIRHVQELMQLMSVMTKDDRFEEACNNEEDGSEAKTMCEVLDRVENRGLEKGIRQGREEGRKEGRREGRKEGRREGHEEIIELLQCLYENDRQEDAKRVIADLDYRNQLLEELFGEKK